MLSLKDETEVCFWGLLIGLLNRNDVAKWADMVIESRENVEYEIIDISLCATKSSLSELELKLSEIKGQANRQLVMKTILGLCSSKYYTNLLSTEDICSILYQWILIDSELYSSDIGTKIVNLTDGYDLAIEGYGNLEDISNDIKKFLDQYTEYSIEF